MKIDVLQLHPLRSFISGFENGFVIYNRLLIYEKERIQLSIDLSTLLTLNGLQSVFPLPNSFIPSWRKQTKQYFLIRHHFNVSFKAHFNHFIFLFIIHIHSCKQLESAILILKEILRELQLVSEAAHTKTNLRQCMFKCHMRAAVSVFGDCYYQKGTRYEEETPEQNFGNEGEEVAPAVLP